MYISTNEIYEQTRGGLDIFLHYYPAARKSLEKKNGKFKVRNERTPSANLYQDNNIWYLKDHGGGKRLNAVELVMDKEHLNFNQALNLINKRFLNRSINSNHMTINKQAVFKKIGKAENNFVSFKKGISDTELKLLGGKITRDICKRYNLKSVEFFMRRGSEYKISSSRSYPIFCFDFGSWKKIYQPLSSDKSFRFSYMGEKPKDFIFGLDHIQSDYEKLKAHIRTTLKENISDKDLDEYLSKNKLKKDIYICSGDRDALNVASLGYNVVWLNSETAVLKQEQYDLLKRFGNDIYIVPDIDETGLKQANELCMKYLDIKLIRLPEELKKFKDFRGNACKDVSDFLRYSKRLKIDFEKLKENAEPLKFWRAEHDSKGKLKTYHINTVSFLNFLQANGYFRIKDKSNEYGYVYIKIKDNIVEKIIPKSKTKGVGGIKMHVKDFLNQYMKYESSMLRNKIFRTKETDESILSNLPIREDPDFETYDKDYMYLAFKNVAWKITRNDIREMSINDIDKYIWKSDIKDKTKLVRKLSKPIFEINYTDEYKKIIRQGKRELIDNYPDIDRYTITINDKDFIFMRFLINTSKMYWQKEKQGIQLTETEKKEQDLHLINKIFSLGYLAHRYKDPDKPWAVFAMDARESELGKSYGGSGKSLCYSSLKYINKTFDIPGRNSEKTKDRFIFDGVDEHTFTINVNDADQYLNFGFFFPYITDDLRVEVKNASAFFIPFSKSAKFIFSSNFSLRDVDPSTKRRLLYTAFSDYYHEKDEDGTYEDITSPGKEFGKKLFLDFTDVEWNKFYNFFASAIQTYMKIDNRIEPPMENIIRKNLKAEIGQNLFEWFNDYFLDTSKLNSEIQRKEMYEYLRIDIPQIAKYLTPQKFKKKLKAFCKYRSWTLNPKERLTNKTQILRGGIEYFYIETAE